MTDRIISNQVSPTTQFVLEADAAAEPSVGANGRWRVRFYLRNVNTGSGPGSNPSQFSGSGYQDGRINGSIVITYGPVAPFLPVIASGAQRWRVGPVDIYVNANANGYWSGSLTALPVQMGLDYGNIEGVLGGSVPMPRIARVPGAPGQPVVSALASTSVVLTWAAAARGNAAIDQHQYLITTPAGLVVATGTVGNVLSATVAGLAPGTDLLARVRAHNGDGWGPYSTARPLRTLSGARVGKDLAFVPGEVLVGVGGLFVPAAEVRVGADGSFVSAG